MCSKELKNADLLYLFNIEEIELSNYNLDDFGDIDYILYRIENELDKQFNTRKIYLLKAMYAYISKKAILITSVILVHMERLILI